MKKVYFLVAIIFLVSSFPAFAAETPTTLKEATINIESFEDKGYQVHESVTLSTIESVENQTIVHTFANVNSASLGDVAIKANGQELQYEWQEGDSLDKLLVHLPENASGEFNYEIQYDLSLQEDSFTTPLFVPLYPSPGTSNIVHLNFKAPEGQNIQKNSFPVVIKKVGNQVENNIMNIPTHVKYVFSEETDVFNFFNYISWGVIIALLAIVFTWFKAELNSKKGVVA
jgi:hypothetical protein